ncbi:MAG: hypothetical protein A3A33_03295 [Candidatus Yanofskybacteria bacterium RIFCSPLOWO2_01_FULL_49_25]|uniref:Uncharacterized protein n=1 Tax=Candidatus Yanofskybacteria bacterium RIFCSPLOWO2_01_FULL_49_25 TaxID=1802701 RepID=A0A1F8GUW4_9BACT|nr:MAG: hypothetical protein A3A33_03295 [Candidatus Yanofskybacteria bacterium RIFCSPLOWO2_01_FULL_49_25]
MNRGEAASKAMQTSRLTYRFFWYVPLFIAITRCIVLLFLNFSKNTALLHAVVYDSFHHYYIAIGLVVAYIFFGRYMRRYGEILLALGVGVLIEEHVVMLYELGLHHLYRYLSVTEFAIQTAVIVLFLICSYLKYDGIDGAQKFRLR